MACGHFYWACLQCLTHCEEGCEGREIRGGGDYVPRNLSLPACHFFLGWLSKYNAGQDELFNRQVRFFLSQKRRRQRGEIHEPLFTNGKAPIPGRERHREQNFLNAILCRL